jgi:hypothetical protein
MSRTTIRLRRRPLAKDIFMQTKLTRTPDVSSGHVLKP